MKRLLTLLVASALVLMGTSAFAAVSGTPHDFTGVGTKGLCETCHVPHAAAIGANGRLWRVALTGVGTGTVWEGTNVGKLCGTCHAGGSLMPAQNAGGDAPTNESATVYSDSSHGNADADLVTLGGTTQGADLSCTSCHDVHNDGNRPFLRAALDSAFCATNCHTDRSGGNNHTFGPVATGGSRNFKDMADVPAAMQTTVGAGSWTLGGKFVQADPTAAAGIGDSISCSTCHTVHKPQAQLLAMSTASACTECHVDSAGVSVGTIAGDHPISGMTDGHVRMTFNGSGAGTAFASTGLTGPTCRDCHQPHNAENATLNVTGYTGCDYCHILSPAKHHSNNGPANVAGTGNDDSSALNCGDCHGAGLGTTAHNGFSFDVSSSNTDSALCEGCHLNGAGSDPAYGAGATAIHLNNGGATFPANHLGTIASGKSSHYLGNFTNDDTATRIKDITSLAGLKFGSGPKLICESCHSVLNGLGAGYDNNLLTIDYQDDNTSGAVGVALCTTCHDVTADTMHPMDASAIGTNCDNAGGMIFNASGNVDCDTCHKPHQAAAGTFSRTKAQPGTAVPVILEKDGVASNDFAAFCQECHTK